MLSCVLVSLPVLTIPNKCDWEIKGTFPGWLSAAFVLNLSTGPHETAFANLGIRINLSAFWVHSEVQCMIPYCRWGCKYLHLIFSLSNKNWYGGEIDVINVTDRRKKKTLTFFLEYCSPSSKASGLALNHSVLVKTHAVITLFWMSKQKWE